MSEQTEEMRRIEEEDQEVRSTMPRTRRLIESNCGSALENPIIQSIVDAAPSASAVIKRLRDLGWPDAVRQARYCYYLKEQYPTAWIEAKAVEPGHHPADTLFGFSSGSSIPLTAVVLNDNGKYTELRTDDPVSKMKIEFQTETRMGEHVLDTSRYPVLARNIRVAIPGGDVLTTFDAGPEAHIHEADGWDLDEWSFMNPLCFYRTASLSNYVNKTAEGEAGEKKEWRLHASNCCGNIPDCWHHGFNVNICNMFTKKTRDNYPHWYKQLEITQIPYPLTSLPTMNRIVVLLRIDHHPEAKGINDGMVMFERHVEMSCKNGINYRNAVVRVLYYIDSERWKINPSWKENHGRFSIEPSIHISIPNSNRGIDHDHSDEVLTEAGQLLRRFYKIGYAKEVGVCDMHDFLGQTVIDNPYRDLLGAFLPE